MSFHLYQINNLISDILLCLIDIVILTVFPFSFYRPFCVDVGSDNIDLVEQLKIFF